MDEFSEAPVVSEDIELDGSSNRNVVSFELEGIMVDFPFQPYDLQKEYMARILRIMKNGGNALLESPTGTGKTLCLLCATLAYRRHTASIAAESTLTAEAFDAPSAASTVAIHPQALNRIHSRAAGGAKDSAPRQRIIYAARTHAQLAQVVKELRATGYRAVVRVLGSRQHLCLNTQVQELPSGQQQYACRSLVSKKKCSFMRRLDDMESRWAQELDSRIHDLEDIVEAGKRNQACPYYMSRIEIKHADVVIVPYNYVFDPGMRKVVGLDELMKDSLVILDEAHNLESFCCDSTSLALSSGTVALAMEEVDAGIKKLDKKGVSDEYVMSVSFKPTLTTSIAPRDADKNAEVGVSKNQLRLINQFLSLLERQMLNLPQDVVRDKSTGRPPHDILKLLEEAGFVIARGDNVLLQMEAAVNFLQQDVDELAGDKDEEKDKDSKTADDPQPQSSTQGGGFASLLSVARMIKDVVALLGPAAAASSQHEHYRYVVTRQKVWRKRKGPAGRAEEPEETTVNLWCFHAGVAMRGLRDMGVSNVVVTSGTLAPLSSFASELGIPFQETLENDHVIQQAQILPMVVSEGPSRHTITNTYNERENHSMLQDEGAALYNMVRLIPGGILVFFPSYPTMERALAVWAQPAAEGGGSILKRATPGFSGGLSGSGGFFKEKPAWETGGDYPPSSTLGMLSKVKTIVTEPRGTALFPEALAKYREGIAQGPGSILFGVCRGKASEGVDFADEQARAVVLIGIPYPALQDPRVIIKRNLLDIVSGRSKQETDSATKQLAAAQREIASLTARLRGLAPDQRDEAQVDLGRQERKAEDARLKLEYYKNALPGSSWYSQSAFRAVNQAVGRVIRHRFDYGAILLMDHRFSYGSNSMYISKWVRKWIRTSKSFTECLKTIRTFTLETIPGLAKTLKVHLDEKAMRCAAHAAAEAEQAGVFEKFHSAKRAKATPAASLAPTDARALDAQAASEQERLLGELPGLRHAPTSRGAGQLLHPNVARPKASLSSALQAGKSNSNSIGSYGMLGRPGIDADSFAVPFASSSSPALDPVASLPILSPHQLRKLCGTVAWPALQLILDPASLKAFKPKLSRLAGLASQAGAPDVAGLDAAARDILDVFDEMPKVVPFLRHPQQGKPNQRHVYFEQDVHGKHISPSEVFPAPASQLPYASDVSRPHTKRFTCISRDLLLAMVIASGNDRHVDAFACALSGANSRYVGLAEGHAGVRGWLEHELRWVGTRVLVEVTAGVTGAVKSDSNSNSVSTIVSVTPAPTPLPPSASAPAASPSPAPAVGLKEQLRLSLRQEQMPIFTKLLTRLKPFKTADPNDQTLRAEAAAIVEAFHELFRSASAAVKLAQLMTPQMPMVCKEEWENMVRQLDNTG